MGSSIPPLGDPKDMLIAELNERLDRSKDTIDDLNRERQADLATIQTLTNRVEVQGQELAQLRGELPSRYLSPKWVIVASVIVVFLGARSVFVPKTRLDETS